MNESVVAALRVLLANTVAFAYKAKGYHWNVTGPSFAQFHEFYGDLYEDLDEAVDPIAENIRKAGALAPAGIEELEDLSQVTKAVVTSDPMAMAQDAFATNALLLASLMQAFEAASGANEQGLMNFLADRIDTHRKHAWMLKSMMAPQSASEVGKSARRSLGLR